MEHGYFSPALFQFLRDLKANNDRAWFQANRERYELDVREPLLHFIADFALRLRSISRHLNADPRPVGGSLFRVHRDTRFSKDKSPYKTHAAAHFRHERGKDVHAPGFYIHLEPDNVFVAGGLWRPDSETLAKVRDAIVEDTEGWRRAISGPAFSATCELEGDKLKRPPSGYDPSHPLIEDLKRKDFVAVRSFTEQRACSPAFAEDFSDFCCAATPFMGFLTTTVGLPW